MLTIHIEYCVFISNVSKFVAVQKEMKFELQQLSERAKAASDLIHRLKDRPAKVEVRQENRSPFRCCLIVQFAFHTNVKCYFTSFLPRMYCCYSLEIIFICWPPSLCFQLQ